MNVQQEDDDVSIPSLVVNTLQKDLLSVELKLALLSSALISYRRDSCLRPFPDFLHDPTKEDGEEKNMEKLEHLLNVIPSLEDVRDGKAVLSEECWRLLHWLVNDKIYSVKTCDQEKRTELLAKTGSASSFSAMPDHVFEIEYHTKASQDFESASLQYGIKYGYHGSRMDNFFSIVSNGLQVHLMKNGLFGEGVYLSEDLSVTMPYVASGGLWKHSSFGSKASCVAMCEILNHPGVKCQVENGDKTRATAQNSEHGEVPNKYFVVTSSNLVRLKYLFMFLDKRKPTKSRERRNRSWVCMRYPVASILFIYVVFLLLMGLWKSRTVQTFWRQRRKANNVDVD